MNEDVSVEDILNRINTLHHGKQWLIDKLKEHVISLRSQGFDLEETLAFIEGTQHERPQNIPIFKLWTRRIWQELEKNSDDNKDKE